VVTFTPANTGVINALAITVTAMADKKICDSTTASKGSPTIAPDLISPDTPSFTQAFSTKNVGTNLTLTPSGTVNDGNGGNNYKVNFAKVNTGEIDQAPLTITAATNTKTYDSTVTAAATPTVTGLQGTDRVTGLAETYDNKNAGTGKTLSVTTYTVNDGNNGNNYTVNKTPNSTGVITQAPLTITAATNTKSYDATVTAAATPTVAGLQGADTVTGLAETYDNKNAATGKTLSVTTYTITDGDNGNNYTVTKTPNTTGVITAAPLTLTAATNTKTYDGTTTAAATPTVAGLQGSDTVTGLAETYDNKNAGTGKTLSVTTYTISDGNYGRNYIVSKTPSTTGVIAQAPLTITAVTYTKTYDGTTAVPATVAPSVAGLQTGDSVSNLSEVYDSPNAGARTLSVATYTISDGNNGNNYAVTKTPNTTGMINPAPLTLTASSFSRYYGLPNPAFTGTYSGFVNGEGPSVLVGTLTCGTAATPGSDVGMYTITCGGQTSPNYLITPVAGTLTIISAPTSTVLASAATGSNGAAGITLTATVGSAVTPAIPGGTVTFVDTSNSNVGLGTPTIGASGQASVVLSGTSLSVGTHVISAIYAPANADFIASTSTPNPNTTLAATISAPSSSNDVFAVNTAINLTASFTATTTANPSAEWTLTNPANPATNAVTAGVVSAPNITGSTSFKAGDVYGFTLTFTDGLGGIVIANTVGGSPATIVIYDPSAGFVTGGGWINSPAGAYTQNLALPGKATFGFVSKYQKGATIPTGDTEFQFQVANFEFHSNTYQWMVVSGSLSQYKGSGTINGAGNYNFLLTGLDGAIAGTGTAGGFRMKITDPSTGSVIYDNLLSSNDTIQAKNTEALGDGSIIIHTGK
jgi:trimeric autotransporter adhesin